MAAERDGPATARTENGVSDEATERAVEAALGAARIMAWEARAAIEAAAPILLVDAEKEIERLRAELQNTEDADEWILNHQLDRAEKAEARAERLEARLRKLERPLRKWVELRSQGWSLADAILNAPDPVPLGSDYRPAAEPADRPEAVCIPPEVVTDHHGRQLLSPGFQRYEPCAGGCGFLIGCGDAVDTVIHESCARGVGQGPAEEPKP